MRLGMTTLAEQSVRVALILICATRKIFLGIILSQSTELTRAEVDVGAGAVGAHRRQLFLQVHDLLLSEALLAEWAL